MTWRLLLKSWILVSGVIVRGWRTMLGIRMLVKRMMGVMMRVVRRMELIRTVMTILGTHRKSPSLLLKKVAPLMMMHQIKAKILARIMQMMRIQKMIRPILWKS
ncbi:hypothetical protein BKA64DRAFT_688775 [Cadophora sp. MPI-SDFR-AT-0126]|nr:hypothetical protein BKA64DRAFT_688775 [Leotiomycetes sp. MPI-SDFR-AT-0126]